MKEEKYIYIGYDICDAYVQISCMKAGESTPEAVSTSESEAGIMIPAALYHMEDTNEWLFGEEAVKSRLSRKGVYYDGFVKKIMEGTEEASQEGKTESELLLGKFILRTLNLIKQKHPDKVIAALAVTMPVMDEKLVDALKEIFSRAGIGEDRLKLINYTECFMHYMLNFDEERFNGNSAVFDNSSGEFRCTTFVRGKIKSEDGCVISSKIIRFQKEWEKIVSENVSEEKEKMLFGLLEEFAVKNDMQALFFTGQIFDEEWTINVLKKLCAGNRVFKGKNLYTRGALYYTKDIKENTFGRIRLLSDNQITSSVSLRIKGERKEMLLIPSGSDYSSVRAEKRIILDESKSVDFYVDNEITGIKRMFSFIPENIPEDNLRFMQLKLTVTMPEAGMVVVKLNDLGFAGVHKSSHRVWEKHFNI